MNEFKTYHPIVNLMYFVCTIGFSMFFMHPICLAISLAASSAYAILLGGRRALRRGVLYFLPMLLFMAAINPAFNHRGVTILTYLPDGNPLTFESIIYGVATAAMILSVITYFSCYTAVMTSDKFIYLFGRVIPSLSLILSMTLRLVPRFAQQLGSVTRAQRGIGRDVKTGGAIKRLRCAAATLSIMITWSLENAIETADSMRSRGYGLRGRTAFSVYRIDDRDIYALICIFGLGIYLLTGFMRGGLRFVYYPSLQGGGASLYEISLFAAYFALCVMPIAMELYEVRKWKIIRSKI